MLDEIQAVLAMVPIAYMIENFETATVIWGCGQTVPQICNLRADAKTENWWVAKCTLRVSKPDTRGLRGLANLRKQC